MKNFVAHLWDLSYLKLFFKNKEASHFLTAKTPKRNSKTMFWFTSEKFSSRFVKLWLHKTQRKRRENVWKKLHNNKTLCCGSWNRKRCNVTSSTKEIFSVSATHPSFAKYLTHNHNLHQFWRYIFLKFLYTTTISYIQGRSGHANNLYKHFLFSAEF